ncbi:unnamed protein product [Kuraishia capsulata CBS 1993]|uniref:Uncharacterized protein n=1 Tax=Kuraishia capsulata CBS 1993 TaxID=1382522 RepID=W6MWU4_9ASCO|nr:uncharacterized protein KUCA_T00003849001 [Kuraishia capsulata CBS 1993]CDK27870.1 unnamed protein product [Kuraishia capsulata CBS 1993]
MPPVYLTKRDTDGLTIAIITVSCILLALIVSLVLLTLYCCAVRVAVWDLEQGQVVVKLAKSSQQPQDENNDHERKESHNKNHDSIRENSVLEPEAFDTFQYSSLLRHEIDQRNVSELLEVKDAHSERKIKVGMVVVAVEKYRASSSNELFLNNGDLIRLLGIQKLESGVYMGKGIPLHSVLKIDKDEIRLVSGPYDGSMEIPQLLDSVKSFPMNCVSLEATVLEYQTLSIPNHDAEGSITPTNDINHDYTTSSPTTAEQTFYSVDN